MNNRTLLFFLSFLSIVTVLIASQSISATCFLLFTLAVGFIVILSTCENKDYKFVVNVFLLSFVVIAIETLLQWLGIEANMASFADDDNDQFKFWTESLRGVSVSSPEVLFKECIRDNVYYENGGYYFYIQLIAYISSHYFDGNHLLTQMYGSSVFGMLSSVFIFHILRKYLTTDKACKYALIYVLLTPVLPDCIMIHRDPVISFLYLVLIYLWLCRKFTPVNFIMQAAIILILINLRLQHGLFAITFLVLSIFSLQNSLKWVYVGSMIALIIVYGISFADYIFMTATDTFLYYDNFTNEQLDGLNTGLGRFVYTLPTPVKEIAQIFFLQLQFPSWGALQKSTNIYQFIIGTHSFVICVFWFYVFSFSVVAMLKYKFKNLPALLKYGLIVFLSFLLLNTSALEVRRVVCVYPILYLVYIYYHNMLASKLFIHNVKRTYALVYVALCLVYFSASVIIGGL